MEAYGHFRSTTTRLVSVHLSVNFLCIPFYKCEMLKKPVSNKSLWVVLIVILIVVLIRLLESTLGQLLGKGAELALLIIAVIVILWLIGNNKKIRKG